jgi:acyl-CoA synthetase (NDP forming)
MNRLSRLLAPRSIAVIGGGTWCANLIRECAKIGFAGPVWPVHPTRDEIGGVPCFRSLADLPKAPDACFIGVNRALTVEVVRDVATMGAGGAVCFASGFREAVAETGDGADLQARLVAAAGDMPFLGPNCYGFINALDRAALWPDQHGCVPVDRGVALITQSSNIAINLTMQQRALPLAYVVTAGNQASVTQADIGAALLEDPRVTALGLHIEGFADLPGWEALARKANDLGKPVVSLKVGASDEAQAATISHTASLAGSDAGASALLARLGIARVNSLPELLETLKLLHYAGPLSEAALNCASCSGGEASLMADTGARHGVRFPPLDAPQTQGLAKALGPKVALANPLDYHTYVWGDVPRMAQCFTALAQGAAPISAVVVDFPRGDRCSDADWTCVLEAGEIAAKASGKPFALLGSLPEGISEQTATDIVERGMIPMLGCDETCAALVAAAQVGRAALRPAIWVPKMPAQATVMTEADSKALLAGHGLCVPGSARVQTLSELEFAVSTAKAPFVIKADGLAHKSDQGGVAFGTPGDTRALEQAARMPCTNWLIEEQITGAVAELLVGVVCDPAHGYVLTLGAGGVQTEILQDTVSALLPVTAEDVVHMLDQLRIAPLLKGYRGRPAADSSAIVQAVLAVQGFVEAARGHVAEVEINPLIATATQAVAADALICMGETE